MNFKSTMHTLWLMLRFRNRDFAEMYPMLRRVIRLRPDCIARITDYTSFENITHSPQYDMGYVLDDGAWRIVVARQTHQVWVPYLIPAPRKKGTMERCATYDISITFPNGMNYSTGSYLGAMPRDIFNLMRAAANGKNLVHGLIADEMAR